jgi:hypothetical protein
VFIVVDDWVLWTYHTTLDPFEASDFGNHVIADQFLADHPELLPGVLFVKWVLVL